MPFHFCQDELIAIEAAIAAVPLIGYGWARLKARVARRESRCSAPRCGGHDAEPAVAPRGADARKA